jgi:hypothetical protein
MDKLIKNRYSNSTNLNLIEIVNNITVNENKIDSMLVNLRETNVFYSSFREIWSASNNI